jgi:hypothetical protein
LPLLEETAIGILDIAAWLLPLLDTYGRNRYKPTNQLSSASR